MTRQCSNPSNIAALSFQFGIIVAQSISLLAVMSLRGILEVPIMALCCLHCSLVDADGLFLEEESFGIIEHADMAKVVEAIIKEMKLKRFMTDLRS
ncbi:MAG: hypothetical protein DI615_04205 [Gardnerella vaginalis]|nr:MAG: hypothetical protein DI615_04205 [Gardnerella vaginalis]PZP09508.1 MAG: hypothetical protein DI614_04205 [Gardnerella vaginalis]